MKLFPGGRDEMLAYVQTLREDDAARRAVFGSEPEALERWAVQRGSDAQRLAVFGSDRNIQEAATRFSQQPSTRVDAGDLLARNSSAALLAVVGEPLVEPVVAAMEAQGALDDQTHGQFCVRPVPRAFTYVAKRRK